MRKFVIQNSAHSPCGLEPQTHHPPVVAKLALREMHSVGHGQDIIKLTNVLYVFLDLSKLQSHVLRVFHLSSDMS